MKQQEALEILKLGHNVFLTGAAGSGKTYLLNQYINYLESHNVSIGITASTGIAATHMGGQTIHSWSGLGIKDALTYQDLEALQDKPYLQKRFKTASVLIIDEISMLHHFRLGLVDKICRKLKQNDAPFGGMQIILCGDFFQLPPVARRDEPKAQFAYMAAEWEKLNLRVCYLEEQHRQNDDTYLAILNAIRDDRVSEEIIEMLTARYNVTGAGTGITKLYTHNIDVDAENERELEKLPGLTFEYTMTSRGSEPLVALLKKGCLAPEKLLLKAGARVMFVKNNFEENYANGTLAVVESCDDDEIIVRDSQNRKIIVNLASWKIDEEGKTKAEIFQYPLRLAWAITVHKSQGMSLDYAQVDLTQAFEKGMGYVALSRVRSLEGLFLKGINHTALAVSEEVLEFDQKFRKASDASIDELNALSPAEKEQKQQEFIERIAGEAKVQKPDTVGETKRLFAEGKSVLEIAKQRGLTEGTIISHLEKLKEKDAEFDPSPLKSAIPADRLEKIIAALQVTSKNDEYHLTPAKTLLGSDFTYEEIRLTRLLINRL